jgi:hypothetical protein
MSFQKGSYHDGSLGAFKKTFKRRQQLDYLGFRLGGYGHYRWKCAYRIISHDLLFSYNLRVFVSEVRVQNVCYPVLLNERVVLVAEEAGRLFLCCS